MSTDIITKDEVIEAVKSIVEADPQRSNNGACAYLTLEGGPNCIAAAVLDHFGLFDPETIREYEGLNVAAIARETDLPYDKEAVDYLSGLQFLADRPLRDERGSYPEGTAPWSLVIREAERSDTADLF